MGDQPRYHFQAQYTDPTVPVGTQQPAPGSNSSGLIGPQFPVRQSRQMVGSAATPPVLASVPFQPANIQQPYSYQKPGMYPSLPAKEEAKVPASSSAPLAEEEKASSTSVISEYIKGIYKKGKELVKSNTIPLPPDNPKASTRARLEECTGWIGDYEKWICPVCTLENSSEFYQCEVCMGENSAVKSILEILNRPGKKHERGRFESWIDYVSSVGGN